MIVENWPIILSFSGHVENLSTMIVENYTSSDSLTRGGEILRKMEKVPGYPHSLWITWGKSVQKRNDFLVLTGRPVYRLKVPGWNFRYQLERRYYTLAGFRQ